MADSAEHREGYGLVTRVLHWTMVVALAGQFALGWALTRQDDLLRPLADRWFGGDQDAVVVAHAALGVVLLALAVVRLAWRAATDLPPWSPALSATERRVVHAVERVLYACMFLIPLTGLGLFLLSGEDWDVGSGREWTAPFEVADDSAFLAAHIATHVVFLAALLVHVAIVVRHTVVRRDHLLSRML